ncbi:hypothetical protein [Pseudanabaena mucicola]|uniref:Apea-like HEPN domain-containing protein n=1 Tax=Pseudanabaena mucicola FACHB-723 TaxID=2692860 RepID=A0ABR7ZUR7_9CYAN|nr:hypothetical protein [Pseudanabaena mucicola]MBD2187269.1 hypothetical protein [Pseudanabaena mucicola FACHB-723]
MATLGGILIADKNSKLDSGAAFLLSHKCNVTELVFIDPNWEVEVKVASPYVVARFKGATDANDAFNKGYILAQQGLDILSVTGKDNLSIKNGDDEYLVWWRSEESEQILRVVTLCRWSIEVSISFATEQTQKPIYHESFRYIRLAQITDDLFDAYRNMYLALEILVSTISPIARKESEKNWLKRVISSSPDYFTEQRIIEEIYKIRCDLFHAKKNKIYILPQKSLDDRKRVSDGLNHLSTLVFKVLRKSQNVRRKTGGIVSSLNEYYSKQSEKMFIILSDDDTPFNANETIDSPTFKSSVKMITRYDYDLSEQNFVALLGSIDASKLRNLSKIARLGLIRGDILAITEVVRASLTYNLIDKLEVQMRLHEDNEMREFKRFFSR